ncbi:hypothetical protein ACGFMK_21620 [Amycolatopsis sp. NPDC049252]|uniref:hypothetical protein n=1 Tax=Amycolatopsis sp. NPDC049252 TaxID=3363933 RepID=UPI003713435F
MTTLSRTLRAVILLAVVLLGPRPRRLSRSWWSPRAAERLRGRCHAAAVAGHRSAG